MCCFHLMPVEANKNADKNKMWRSLVPLFLNCEILFALIESGINPYIERERGMKKSTQQEGSEPAPFNLVKHSGPWLLYSTCKCGARGLGGPLASSFMTGRSPPTFFLTSARQPLRNNALLLLLLLLVASFPQRHPLSGRIS